LGTIQHLRTREQHRFERVGELIARMAAAEPAVDPNDSAPSTPDEVQP
jgi:hypothetical protein